MKMDKTGAATVIAAAVTTARIAPGTPLLAVAPMVENMPGPHSTRPGDVVKALNGKMVDITNTDAEGRLILADALTLAADAKPDAIIDLATLTGACVVALGPRIAGLMGNNDGLIEQIRVAGRRAGEQFWPLPLPPEYRKDLESEVADLKNISGGRYGGALTAGLFLQEFVDGRPWAHLDIAGPARFESDDAYVPKGGSGFGVRTIVETVLAFKKPR
jgi:leucyl aminopeptidase